ncbi:MAG: 50S ribosomal protein L17 [Bacteroidetes bacterium HGW-Bacteroidetes-7]|jgi:large subunit ribosomal protein L17|nr:MAG: 50S ribosomal protein L17 [Bacteroidetes bacterium HGW-Bacteroidetes-7]
MRHNKTINHLGRKSGHRKAMLANMASSLIIHKRIETTLAKAKALRMYIEPLITKSKDDTTHSRRTVFSYLKQKEAITELFRTIAPKIADRPGGYTRVLKLGFRKGDAAEMAMIELVDFNETALAYAKTEVKKSTTRRSRAKKSEETEAEVKPAAKAPKAKKEPKAEAKAEVKAEEVVVAAPVADVTPEVAPAAEAEATPAAEATPEAEEPKAE